MTEINSWSIRKDEDGQPFTATFGPDEFETWFLACPEGTNFVGEYDRNQMLLAMVDLAQAEERRMTQNINDLWIAIKEWADDWNEKAAKLTRAVEKEG